MILTKISDDKVNVGFFNRFEQKALEPALRPCVGFQGRLKFALSACIVPEYPSKLLQTTVPSASLTGIVTALDTLGSALTTEALACNTSKGRNELQVVMDAYTTVKEFIGTAPTN